MVELTLGNRTHVAFPWGQVDQFGSAAYWIDQARGHEGASSYKLGTSFVEEVVACLLGGYGIPAEVGLSAFARVRNTVCLDDLPPPSSQELEALLLDPLPLAGGRLVRYRFPRQRARYVANALALLATSRPPSEVRALRDWLTQIPGIGPKTASWIVRNQTGSDDVAVVDVHVRRAGLVAGVFKPEWRLPNDYHLFEEAFCLFARAGSVSTAILDACIWSQLRTLGARGRRLFLDPDARSAQVPPMCPLLGQNPLRVPEEVRGVVPDVEFISPYRESLGHAGRR